MSPASISRSPALSPDQIAFFQEQGYLIVPGVFGPDEVAAVADHFSALVNGEWSAPARMWEPKPDAADILERFPRVMQPHRYDALAKEKLLHPRVQAILQVLLGEEPVAAQSMYYFKPPGARGQAFHQDNFYLDVQPGSCIAAWTAIDPSTTKNGGLFIVPQTAALEVQCPEQANEQDSYFRDLVKPPPGKKAVPASLNPGDTLFFNGSVIHGSGPNRSPDQWRRSFICHYVPRSTESVAEGYFPLLDFDGREVPFKRSTGGGPCGDGWRPSSYAA